MSTTASASMPMPGGVDQVALLNFLDRSASPYPLVTELPQLASNLEADVNVRRVHGGAKRTVAALRNDNVGSKWTMATLLYSMDMATVKAIVRGTVARDALLQNVPWLQGPSSAAPPVQGVYVIGLRRESSLRGDFLTSREIRQVVDGIDKYLLGHEADGSQLPQHRTPRCQAAIRYRRRVDLGTNNTIISGSGKDRQNARQLRETLLNRALLSEQMDPSGTTPHRQSPLYAGCSTNLYNRLAGYNDRHCSNANPMLLLMLAVAKYEKLDLVPETRVVLRTWAVDQLKDAETLIVTLAGSLLGQHGFNRTEGGGSSLNDNTDFDMLKGWAFRRAALKTNIGGVQAELDRRVWFINTLIRVKVQAYAEHAALTQARRACTVPSNVFSLMEQRFRDETAKETIRYEAASVRQAQESVLLRLTVAGNMEEAGKTRSTRLPRSRRLMDRATRGVLQETCKDSQEDVDVDMVDLN